MQTDSSVKGPQTDGTNQMSTSPQSSGQPAGSSRPAGAQGGAGMMLAIAGLLGVAVVVLVVVLRGASTPREVAPGPTGPGSDQAQTSQSRAQFDDQMTAVANLVRDQQWPQAQALLGEIIARTPDTQEPHVTLAQVMVAQGRDADAHDQYVRALEIGPRTPELEFAAGTAASAAGRLSQAAAHYQATEAARPDEWQAPLYLAQVLIKLQRPAEAKVRLLRVQQMKPDEPIAWGSMAQVLLDENATGLALQMVARAREIEPDNLLWRIIQARALKREGKPREALDALAGLSDGQLLEPGVLPLLGECHGLLRQPQQAAEVYSRVADAFPQMGEVALGAAQWWERAGDAAKARNYAQRAKVMSVAGAEDLLARLEGK